MGDTDFQVVYGKDFRRLSNQTFDVVFVNGLAAPVLQAEGVKVPRLGHVRVYSCDWARGPRSLSDQVKRVKKGEYHLVLATQPMQLPALREVHSNVVFVDRGFDPKVFYPREGEPTRDIVFVGNYNGYGRMARLNSLAREFPGKVEWTKGHRHPEAAAILRSGTIGWNQIMHGPPHADQGINYRVWEEAASRILVFSSWSRDIPLQDGVHYVAWRSTEEMLDKAGYYLTHDAEREAIAEAGYQEAIAKHTWTHRAQQIKREVEKLL